jgi:tetratricopeptide (TPR) repeat protein
LRLDGASIGCYSEGMRNHRCFVIIAAGMLMWCAVSAAQSTAGSHDEAQRLADQALAIGKKADQMMSGWESVYDRGIATAERAIAIDPTVADGHYALFVNLGRKAERAGMAAQSMKLFRLKGLLDKTLELDPRHAHAWEAKGEMLMRLPGLLGGSETEGERALRRSAELAPTWPKPPLRLAELDWKRGRADQARAEAEHAKALAAAAGDEDLRAEAEGLLNQMSRKL